jgi:hypothetical protein
MRVVSRRALETSLSGVYADCEEGGEGGDGGCLGGACVTRDDGADVDFFTLPVAVEGVDHSGVFFTN